MTRCTLTFSREKNANIWLFCVLKWIFFGINSFSSLQNTFNSNFNAYFCKEGSENGFLLKYLKISDKLRFYTVSKLKSGNEFIEYYSKSVFVRDKSIWIFWLWAFKVTKIEIGSKLFSRSLNSTNLLFKNHFLFLNYIFYTFSRPSIIPFLSTHGKIWSSS